MRKVSLAVVLFVALFALGCNSVPDSPDGVVKASVEALKTGELDKIYNMLPESYQKDVQALFAEAGKIDAEMYNGVMALLPKAVQAIEKQKGEIDKQLGAMGMKVDTFLPALKLVVEALDKGGIMKADGLAKADVPALLKATGAALMTLKTMPIPEEKDMTIEAGLKKLDSLKVTVIKTEGDKSELEIEFEGKKEKVAFVKVEGKWIPEELAKVWKPGIEMAKKQIAEAVKSANEFAPQAKPAIAAAAAAIDEFEKTGKMEGLMGLAGAIPGM